MSFNDPAAGPQAPPPSPQSPQAPQAPVGAMAAPMGAGTPELTGFGKRVGAALLEFVLIVVTLFIGWLIWLLIVMGRGQTPAKQVLNMRVVNMNTGQASGWGAMFVREFLAKTVIGFVAVFTLYIIYLWPLWDDKNQELWDKMCGTVVVEDPNDALAPA